MFGQSYRQTLDNNTYLDVSIYPKKWTTYINMSLWEEGNHIALASIDKTFINFDKFLPMKLAKKLAIHFINNQSQKIANFNLINGGAS